MFPCSLSSAPHSSTRSDTDNTLVDSTTSEHCTQGMQHFGREHNPPSCFGTGCLYLVPWGLLSLPTHSGSLGATELSTIQIYGPHLQLMQLTGLKARQHPPSSVVHHTGFPYEMLRDAHFCYETAEIGEAEDARISGGDTESWQQ